MANEAATAKDGDFLLISMVPDVCFTPKKPPHGVPVPYPIMHKMDKSKQCSPNVFFRGQPAYLHEESYVGKVTGDEPGMGKGVVSGTHTKISRSQQHSKSVFVNGRALVRTGDMVHMNRSEPGGGGQGSGKKPPLPREREADQPCKVGAHKDLKCAPGCEAHHIVPDTLLRTSNRKDGMKGKGRILKKPSFEEGPCICLSGTAPSGGKSEHQTVHQWDKKIRAAADKNKTVPACTAIAIAIEAVVSVRPTCAEAVKRQVERDFPNYKTNTRPLNAAWRPPKGEAKAYLEKMSDTRRRSHEPNFMKG